MKFHYISRYIIDFYSFFFRAMASRLAPTITLNNGRKIPQLGLGTWLVSMRQKKYEQLCIKKFIRYEATFEDKYNV